MLFSPDELVRLELLNYEAPEGLHPVELAWRNLAKKLLEQNKRLQAVVIAHHDASFTRHCLGDDCSACAKYNYKPFKFPEGFKAND